MAAIGQRGMRMNEYNTIEKTEAWQWVAKYNGADNIDGDCWDWLFDQYDTGRDVPARLTCRNRGMREGSRHEFKDGSAIVYEHAAWDFGIHRGHLESVAVCEALCDLLCEGAIAESQWEADDLKYVWPEAHGELGPEYRVPPEYNVRVNVQDHGIYHTENWPDDWLVPNLEAPETLLIEAIEAGNYGCKSRSMDPQFDHVVRAYVELICPLTDVVAVKGDLIKATPER